MSKKNILMVGPLDTAGGWGNAFRMYARAFSSFANVNLQNFYMGGSQIAIDDDLQKLVNNRSDEYDALVQVTFPQWFVPNTAAKKNIGITFTENSMSGAFLKSSRMSQLDTLIVSSSLEKEQIKNGHGLLDIVVCPPPFTYAPIERHEETRTKLTADDKTIVFYTIGEFSDRKNIDCIIKAYLREFSQNDNVLLVIKTNQDIVDYAKDIQKTMGCGHAAQYPKMLIIHENISPQDIENLHSACDIYVNASRGEALCIPGVTAMRYGHPTIIPEGSPMQDFNKTYVFSATEEVCFVKNKPIKDYYSSDTTWREPSCLDLSRKMRETYKNFGQQQNSYDLSSVEFDEVVRKLKETINE